MLLRILAVASLVTMLGTPITAGAQGWRAETDTSPVTGKRTVMIFTMDLLVPGPYPSGRPTSFLLAIRCSQQSGNRPETFIHLGRHTAARSGCMAYKMDNDPPAEECGLPAANGHVYVLREPTKFIKALIGKSTLLVEVPTHGNGRVVGRFSVAGLDKQLPALKPLCQWE